MARHLIRLIVSGSCACAAIQGATAQDLSRCAVAESFMSDRLGMVTRVEVDTLDDVRTGKTLPACRITAAGERRSSPAAAAREFFERLRSGGWERTPDPVDAPNESFMRFRLGETDCLFNVYSGILLGTSAELEVSNAVAQTAGAYYNVLVQCIPAEDPGWNDGTPRPQFIRARRGVISVIDISKSMA